jgi:LPS-assembly protein
MLDFIRRHSVRRAFLLALVVLPVNSAIGQVQVPAERSVMELEAKQQRREGNVFYADGAVDIHFEQKRLRADHVEYHQDTKEAGARGHVQFDFETQHLEADEAHYNIGTGRGIFRHVLGSVRIQRRPNPNVLVSPNPLYIEAQEVERLDEHTYKLRHAWITVCTPERPTWKFYARSAKLRLDRNVALVNANFRLFRVPLIYLPYATAPAGRNLRQSGFLVPDFGNSSRKGYVMGDSYYWAPTGWFDLTLGAQLLSRRGWSQVGNLRARPWENVRMAYNYFGVVDRGLPGPNGVRMPQGGHESRLELEAQLPNGWRAVADINQLTSLTFRLAFAETFREAINSEVRTTAFVTNNFRGFSLNFSALSYKNFLSAQPETAVVLRSAPGVRFSSVEQAPWRRWPFYFGFHVFADAVHRNDPNIETPAAVPRAEIAPRVTLPLHWGPWLGVTPTFMLRTTYYGSQLLSGSVVGDSVRRTTGELTVDLRPPSLARIWERPASKWKHSIEPRVVYRFVDGVNQFGRFIRFDENDTLTDTNEVEYSITQRLYRRTGEGQTDELVSWRIAQKYYFDPTFGGALVPGQRNVFQALDSITPFAFADSLRRFSPLVSDVRVTPGGRYDLEFRTYYDPVLSKLTAIGTILGLHPYRQSFINLAHFTLRAEDPILQPKSNQIRVLVGWGQMNRRGWNSAVSWSYDLRQHFSQNQVVQVSYNGTCCGISFEFRRLALGPVRSDNRFRVALLLANVGTFGTLRRQEKIF